ncbi:unnamed protein product [Caenorhabditis nigoni]
MTPLETFEAGLCTVIPTVFEKCENDWISKNGTCYQDSCCMSFEAATSWYYRMAQFSHVVFSGIGIVIIITYLISYRPKHILPENVRVLVDIMLLLIFVHSIDMILLHLYHIIRSLQVSSADPCLIREKVSFCAPFRYTYAFCSMALAICTYGIYIDRSRFDIVRHFSAAVDVESSEFLYRTTGTQAAIMALFSIASLGMRLVYNSLPRPVGLTIATLSYIFSIYSFVVPWVIVQYVQKTSENRKSRILSHVGMKSVGAEGAENYFGMMKSQWE